MVDLQIYTPICRLLAHGFLSLTAVQNTHCHWTVNTCSTPNITIQWRVFLCCRLLQLFWLLFCLPASAGQCRPVQLGAGRAVENSPVTRGTTLQPACCTIDTEDSIDTRYLNYTEPCLVWAFTTTVKTSSVVFHNMWHRTWHCNDIEIFV